METVWLPKALFYGWWLLANGILYYAEFDFLIRFTGAPKRSWLTCYLGTNLALTFLVLYFGIFSIATSLIHLAMMMLFAAVLLKLDWRDALAPAAILFTLSTFLEGFSALLMRLAVTRVTDSGIGLLIQVLLSASLDALFLLILRLLCIRYAATARQTISSYLHVLLLPSVFLIWAVRSGLGLDHASGINGASPLGRSGLLWAFLWVLGAFLMFFLAIEVFHRIVNLAGEEREKALLALQLAEQRSYIQEARKRNEQYRSFQHDIHNHLLVLAGLTHEHREAEAWQYLDRLRQISDGLLTQISTGNAVLDILLKEKLNYASQNGIEAVLDIRIPENLPVDDMDLCILFSNGIDNAIHACLSVEKGDRRISISARVRRRFLVVGIVNSAPCRSDLKRGTGMKNMEYTVMKYNGTLEAEASNGEFRLSALLCLDGEAPLPSAQPG